MGSASSIGGMMGGVVGGDAGWKLFNEGSSLVEEGVVVFVTQQHVLVVWKPNNRITSMYLSFCEFMLPSFEGFPIHNVLSHKSLL